jgi:hypothetical protein
MLASIVVFVAANAHALTVLLHQMDHVKHLSWSTADTSASFTI